MIAAMETLAPLAPGRVLQVTATDLNAPSSVAAWCRQSEHELLSLYLDNGRFIFLIRRGPNPA
jgi:TusA-related sulfurtransferase